MRMKLFHFLCCLDPDVASVINADDAGRPPSQAGDTLNAGPESAALVKPAARLAACSKQLTDGAAVACATQTSLDGAESCRSTSDAGRQAAPGGRLNRNPVGKALAPLPEDRTLDKAKPLYHTKPQQCSDRLSVARQGLAQLMMDLRFRPGEELPMATFCHPSIAATAAGPGAASQPTKISRTAEGPQRVSRRLLAPSCNGAATTTIGAAAPATRQPPAEQCGEDPQQRWRRHSLPQSPRRCSSAGGSAAVDREAPQRPSAVVGGDRTAAATAAAATGGGGGLSGGAHPRRVRGPWSGGRHQRLHDAGRVAATEAAAALMLQPSLRTEVTDGGPPPVGSPPHGAAPLPDPALSPVLTAAAAAPAAAAGFGSSVSLSHPMFTPAPAAALLPSPPRLPGPVVATALRPGAEVGEAAGALSSYWAMLRGSSSGSSSSHSSDGLPRPHAASLLDRKVLPVDRAAESGATHFPTVTPKRKAQMAANQMGVSDAGRGMDGSRGAWGAAVMAPPAAPSSLGGRQEGKAGCLHAKYCRPSSTGRTASALVPPEAEAAATAAGAGGPPPIPSARTASAVDIARAGASAGAGAIESDSSYGSTVSVSFAGLGGDFWVATSSVGPAYGGKDVRASELVLLRTTPVLNQSPAAAAAATPATPAPHGGVASATIPCTAATAAAASRGPLDVGAGAEADAAAGDTDSATSAAVLSLSGGLRRSASVPAIAMERPEELTTALGAGQSGDRRAGTRATGVGTGAARGLFAAGRHVSFLVRGPSPRQPQPPAAGWRTSLVVLPAVRQCGVSHGQPGGGGGGAANGGAASAGTTSWRNHRRSQNLSGRGVVCRRVSRCGPVMVQQPGSGGGGGGSVSGIWLSSGVWTVVGADGSGPRRASSATSTGSAGRSLQPPAAATVAPAAASTAATAIQLLELPPHGKSSGPTEVMAEAHGLVAVPTCNRRLPYASKYMSQMALMPFLQQQSSSAVLFQAVNSSAPASFNLPALSREVTGLRWIGQGGGGVVFQGMWQGVPVAVKFLLTEADGGVDAAALEGVVSTVVNHPNVLHTYAFECSRLTEASFAEPEPQPGSGEEGGTELLESLMESCTTFSDSLHAIRRTRYLHSLVAGIGVGAGGTGGGGGGGGGAPLRLSRLGVPSLGDLPPLTAASSSSHPPFVAATTSGATGSSEWASAGIIQAAAAAVEAAQVTGAAAATAAPLGRGGQCPSGRARSVQVGSPMAAAAAAAAAAGGGGGGGGGDVPRALSSWFVDVMAAPGPGPSTPQSSLSPPRSPSAAMPRTRSPLSSQRRNAASATAATAAGSAAVGSDAADVDMAIAGGNDAGGGYGGVGVPPSPGVARLLSGGGHGGDGGGGLTSTAWARLAKQTTAFHSEDGFGDPEACLGSQCWTVRQVLSYLKARPGMYMTHIIMEYCDRGSLLAAIKRGVFRTDSTWPDEDAGMGSLGAGGAVAPAGGRFGGGGGSGGAGLWTPAAAIAGGRALESAVADSQPHTHVQAMGSACRRLIFRALLRTARDVAQGMCHLHSNGIIHGDLKPGNVLLRGCRSDRRGFTALVSDFGLSKVTRGEKPLDLNHWSTVTVMAPEVIMGTWLKASDVFSFGILLWQLVTGEMKPYGSCTAAQILVGVSQGTLKPEWPASAHPALVRLGRACLANSPEKRPSFEAIVKMLTKIEKDVRSQLQQTQSYSAAPRKLRLQQQPPSAAAPAVRAAAAPATALGAAHRARGVAAHAVSGNAGGGGSAIVTLAFVSASGGGGGGGAGAGSHSRVHADGSFNQAVGAPAGSTSASGFSGAGGWIGGGKDCGSTGGPQAGRGVVSSGGSGGVAGGGGTADWEAAASGCNLQPGHHTARQLRIL